jgi:hypothetical protein
MTKEKFISAFEALSGFSTEDMQKIGIHAVPCDCGAAMCRGWKMEKVKPQPCTDPDCFSNGATRLYLLSAAGGPGICKSK